MKVLYVMHIPFVLLFLFAVAGLAFAGWRSGR